MPTKRQFLLSSIALATSLTFTTITSAETSTKPKKALVIVSLADNDSQGIVPIPSDLGNGQNPRTNLYWGALYGVKTYFKKLDSYTVINEDGPYRAKGTLDRISIFPKDRDDIEIHALAIDGRFQQAALSLYNSGLNSKDRKYDLVVYIGHNPLMDINPNFTPVSQNEITENKVKAVVLACQSRTYFKDFIGKTNGEPYVMTNGNMAPEAYTLEGILDAWINNEGPAIATKKAAAKYAKFQKIPLKNANWLFSGT